VFDREAQALGHDVATLSAHDSQLLISYLRDQLLQLVLLQRAEVQLLRFVLLIVVLREAVIA
jgi:hypothetical protein